MSIADLFGEIRDMHAARPHGSPEEKAWVREWIMSLPGAVMDDYDNVWVQVGESKTIFACHTDTVHRDSSPLQVVITDDGVLNGYQNGKRSVLGADDTAGCWILRKMIQANVPGTYIFHRGEEVGCMGSGDLVGTYDLSHWSRVISFDRRGTGDIITHQRGRRCCSQAFAGELAERLNAFAYGFDYAPSSHGVFTDSAEYVPYVSECTNISVGYDREHTANESLDLRHLVRLAAACIQLDWETLPVERDYTVAEYDNDRPGDLYGGWQAIWLDDDTIDLDDYDDVAGRRYKDPQEQEAHEFYWMMHSAETLEELAEMIEDNPILAAINMADFLGLRLS